MTLDHVVQQPGYWLLLVALLVGAKLLMRIRLTDFRMIAVLTLSQFVAHAVVATGLSVVSWFCIAFWACFVGATSVLAALSSRRNRADPVSAAAPTQQRLKSDVLDTLWVTAARCFLTVYWAVHLVVIPPNFGVVAVSERLLQEQNEKLMAFATPLVLPALAACMWIWLQRGYRLRWWDFVPLGLSLVGMLGSTSKVNVLPVLLAFLGVVALRRKPWREMRVGLLLAGLALAALLVRLVLYFPGGDLAVAAQTIAFRVAAATDSIDYLVRGHLNPLSYPFAGPGALFPFLTKRLGYAYTYGPGAWLYGRVRGDYSGYGPNPGIVMDYFANLHWLGLLVPVVLSVAAFAVARRPSARSASLLAVLWFACADVQLFELALIPQLVLLGGLQLAVRVLASRGRVVALQARLGRTTRPNTGRRRRPSRLSRVIEALRDRIASRRGDPGAGRLRRFPPERRGRDQHTLEASAEHGARQAIDDRETDVALRTPH